MGYVKQFKKTEEMFLRTLRQKFKGEPNNSTTEEDINDHWDVGLNIKFDVKAIKRIKRSDGAENENFHWVELKNVNGDLGWLYGKADYFVFEVEDYWIVAQKEQLQEFLNKKLAGRIYSQTPELYKLYRREGRKDLITLVKTIDLMAMAEMIVEK